MKPILLSLLLVIATSVSAQTNLQAAFNSTASGRNVSFTFSKTQNNHELGAGLRYNIGMLAMPDDQGNLYYKRLYPSTFGQHFGLQTFYNYHILKNWEHLLPFMFFDLQGTYSTTRNVFFNALEATRYGAFTWLEQYIGIGYKVNLPNNFFITQKMGVGGMLIFGSDDQLMKEKVAWEFGGILSLGIGCRLN